MTEVHGGAAVVEVLRAFGVSHFFTVPGESFLPVLDALHDEPPIRLVTTRHESGASFAAEAFAKVAGRPAVCMATRGPGAANLSIGIQTARYDATPLVALLGLIPTGLQGSGAFQEFDPLSMYGSLAKRSLTVGSRASLGPIVAQALTEATTGRPGPVVVGVPTDLLSAAAPPAPFTFPAHCGTAEPDVRPLLDLLGAAARPAVVMSTGAVRGACAADMGTVAAALAAPVLCGWRRFSAFDNGHPSFAGSLGLGTPPAVVAALDRSDVVLALGPLDQVTIDVGRLDRAGLTVVSVSAEPDPHLARRLASARVISFQGDPAVVADRLAGALGPAESVPAAPRPEPPGGRELDADAAMAELSAWAADDAIVVSDAGDFAHALLRRFRFDRGRSFLGPLNGAMGYGLPGAIGASLAAPGRQVICVAGDGGLLMTAGEMETAARTGLDLVAVVVNNRAYGTIRTRQAEAFPGREYGTELGEVRFAGIAEAMGWRAWSVATRPELETALAGVAATDGCRLVEVRLP